MAKHEDVFSTKDILGNLTKHLTSFRDPLNDPEEIKKRTNLQMNYDVDYYVFKQRIAIQENYIEFIRQKQSEFERLHEKNKFHAKESEEKFINSLREANQVNERLSKQQLDLMYEMHQKLIDMLKTINEKISFIVEKIQQSHEKIKEIDQQLKEVRGENSQRWIDRFDKKIIGFEDINVNLKINDELNFNLVINEEIFRDLARKIGVEIQLNNMPAAEVNSFVELRCRELLNSMLEQEVKKVPAADRKQIFDHACKHPLLEAGVKALNTRVWGHVLQDKEIKAGFAKELKLEKQKAEQMALVEKSSRELVGLEDLKKQCTSLKSQLLAGKSVVFVPAPASAQTLESNFSKSLSDISASTANLEKIMSAADTAFEKTSEKVSVIEASAHEQLSNGKAEAFNPDDLLASLTNATSSFLDTLKTLGITTQPEPEKSPRRERETVEDSPTLRPGR